MKLKLKNTLFAVAASCLVVFGGTLAFLKDTDSKKNVVEIGNIKLELTETQWNPETEKTAVPGQIFAKNPVLTNSGKNDEYVFLEVLIPMEEVQMLYEGDVYSNGQNPASYAIKFGNKYYEAEAFSGTDGNSNSYTVYNSSKSQEITSINGYTLICESGTKKGIKELQEIFRTLTDSPSGSIITKDGDFGYNSGDNTQAGWIILNRNDWEIVTERDIQSGETKSYRRYLFGYNTKLKGSSSTSNTTSALFDKIQLKSFIDGDLLGEEKPDGEGGYESKPEEIKVNAFGIQADNLNLGLDLVTYLTNDQLNQIYAIAKQKME